MLITVEKLSKSYQTNGLASQVLRNVSLGVEKGSVTVVLGPSGSCKSTLLNIIGGVDRADSGTVVVDGLDVTGMEDARRTEYRRADIGFVFQFYNLVPNLTVKENIEVIAHISKAPLPVQQVLEAVDLTGYEHRFPRELSGGEQQRVAIARAIVKNPKLLLCDEPTGALDFETSRKVLALLERANRQFGATLLMITHNEAIGHMAHQVLKLRSGEIVDAVRHEQPAPAERIEW